MLGLTQSVSYAVSALACLGDEGCEKAFVRDIAKCALVPPAYLAKLFTRLVATGLIESKRGWAGGNRLARPPEEITLLDIAEAIEGREWQRQCLLGDAECSDERGCPTHDFWAVTRTNIERELSSRTLADVIRFNARSRDREKSPRASDQDDITPIPEESSYGSR